MRACAHVRVCRLAGHVVQPGAAALRRGGGGGGGGVACRPGAAADGAAGHAAAAVGRLRAGPARVWARRAGEKVPWPAPRPPRPGAPRPLAPTNAARISIVAEPAQAQARAHSRPPAPSCSALCHLASQPSGPHTRIHQSHREQGCTADAAHTLGPQHAPCAAIPDTRVAMCARACRVWRGACRGCRLQLLTQAAIGHLQPREWLPLLQQRLDIGQLLGASARYLVAGGQDKEPGASSDLQVRSSPENCTRRLPSLQHPACSPRGARARVQRAVRFRGAVSPPLLSRPSRSYASLPDSQGLLGDG